MACPWGPHAIPNDVSTPLNAALLQLIGYLDTNILSIIANRGLSHAYLQGYTAKDVATHQFIVFRQIKRHANAMPTATFCLSVSALLLSG